MDFARFRLLLLFATLLLAQWSGLAHAVGGHQHDQDEPPGACALCAVHAALGHGLAAALPPLPVLPSAKPAYQAPPALNLEARPPLSRSRGPPSVV